VLKYSGMRFYKVCNVLSKGLEKDKIFHIKIKHILQNINSCLIKAGPTGNLFSQLPYCKSAQF
jgi:hypothetical protein